MDCVTIGSSTCCVALIESLDYHWIVLLDHPSVVLSHWIIKLLDYPCVVLNHWIINGLCHTTGLST